MFIAALITTGKNSEQPKCPPTGEWIDEVCYIHTVNTNPKDITQKHTKETINTFSDMNEPQKKAH